MLTQCQTNNVNVCRSTDDFSHIVFFTILLDTVLSDILCNSLIVAVIVV